MSATEAREAEVVERSVESRLVLAFTVGAQIVAERLPDGWRGQPLGPGPSAGANLLLVLADRHLVEPVGENAGFATHSNLLAVVALPARGSRKGDEGLIIASGISRAAGAPGPYGVFACGDGTMSRSLRASCNGVGLIEERWTFSALQGDSLVVEVSYALSTPIRTPISTHAYSSADPSFMRTYRGEQGSLLLRSPILEAERIKSHRIEASGPDLSGIFTGAHSLVSVTAVPWLIRHAELSSK